MHKTWSVIVVILILITSLCGLTACDSEETDKQSENQPSSKNFVSKAGRGEPLTIVAGSENKVLEPLLESYAEKSGQKITMDYLGSLDIMQLLSKPEVGYDAVWPASTIWLNMGDTNHVLKHSKTIAVTPVIFGIRRSLAEDLGFIGRDNITMKEIAGAIAAGKLHFAMTSATQSNSGASAYLAFLTALSNHPEAGLSAEDLADPQLGERISNLLAGVNRSSGSSNWLVELFLMGNYDAMVNYEQLIIQTNEALEKKQDETLYAVYPVDGLSLSDSPLAYVDRGDDAKEQAFLSLQDYLLSDEGQDRIEKTGKRNAFSQVEQVNKDIFRKDWGIQVDRTLSPIHLPKNDVIAQALSLYQSQFKKPAYTVYILDYSGSMAQDGCEQMLASLEQIWLPDLAKQNLLQGTEQDVSVFLPFGGYVGEPETLVGNDLSHFMELARRQDFMGGTHLLEAGAAGLKELAQVPNITEKYTPAIVLLTDGRGNGTMSMREFADYYRDLNLDIPIFSIQFGDAQKEELQSLADLSKARVFDGRKDLTGAFRQVKGYN